jgi:hypothetical protein
MMESRRTRSALAAAAVCAIMAAPAQGQRIADLGPGAVSHAQPAAAPEIASAPVVLAASRDLAPALRPPAAALPESAEVRRLSVAGHAGVGALAGLAVGALASAALFAFDADCRRGESMCGLAIPVFVGGGVATGAVTGLAVGLIRNR